MIMLEFQSGSRNIVSRFNWPSFSLSPLKQAAQLKANPLKKSNVECISLGIGHFFDSIIQCQTIISSFDMKNESTFKTYKIPFLTLTIS